VTTRRIMTALFREAMSSAHPRIATAMQRAIVDFADRPPSTIFAHPRFWAPFILFGDGGATLRNQAPRSTTMALNKLEVRRFNQGGENLRIARIPGERDSYISG